MHNELILPALLSGFLCILVPGPVFLCLAGLTPYKGKSTGAKVIAGSLVGDIGWMVLAFATLIYFSSLDERVFLVLQFFCGSYLVFFGLNGVLNPRHNSKTNVRGAETPFRRGLALGIVTHRSYPLMLATFMALLNDKLDATDLSTVYWAFGYVLVGVLAAYAIFVIVCSIPFMRRTFINFSVIAVKIFGVVFVVFGAQVLARLIWDIL